MDTGYGRRCLLSPRRINVLTFREKNLKVMVGDPVSFIITAPPGTRIANTGSWRIAGAEFSKGYRITIDEGKNTRHSDEDKKWLSLAGFFSCGSAAGQRTAVAYRQPIKDGFKSKHVFVDVYQPKVKLVLKPLGNTALTNPNNKDGCALSFGVNGPGIELDTDKSSIDMPRDMPDAVGQVGFLQLYCARRKRPGAAENFMTGLVLDVDHGARHAFQGPTFPVRAGLPAWSDQPMQGLVPGPGRNTVNDNAFLYLMFKPQGGDWVPLQCTMWGWGGTVDWSMIQDKWVYARWPWTFRDGHWQFVLEWWQPRGFPEWDETAAEVGLDGPPPGE